MAIKVALAAALLVALLALSGATTFTTTVTTTTFDVEESRQSQCRQQLQGRRFRACQSYLTQQGPYLEMATVNPQQEQQHRAECCRSLKEIEQQRQQCGCEAIRKALKEAQQDRQMQQSEEVYERAKNLPRVCGMRTQQCQMSVIFV